MLQETLKQATRNNHDALEGLMYVQEIMNGTLTVNHYKEILVTNYTVHNALEGILHDSLSQSVADELDLNSRNKLTALKADLQEIEIPEPFANATAGLTIGSDAWIMGALYVMEGATLGGNVIVKKLKTNPNLNTLNLNFNYYHVYGTELIPQWKRFVEVLNKQPESAYPDSIAGATEMFNYIASVQKFNKLNSE